jgi:predicted DNA-binding transcriptional regulator AlpA
MTDAAQGEDRYLSLDELVSYSGLSRRTLERHMAAADNPLPHFHIDRRVLVRRSDFDGWIERVGRPRHVEPPGVDLNKVREFADGILGRRRQP